jgi:hypothetical protein
MLRVSILTEIPPLLRELGHDPGQVLAEAGLDPALLNDPDNTIPFHAVGALIENCVMLTGCDHFGLLLGQRGGAETSISLGYAGASPFTRAFKRWTGLTPGVWRARHASGTA